MAHLFDCQSKPRTETGLFIQEGRARDRSCASCLKYSDYRLCGVERVFYVSAHLSKLLPNKIDLAHSRRDARSLVAEHDPRRSDRRDARKHRKRLQYYVKELWI
ncbi:hypothetical protein S58_34840 [Bradyrhizobium oligotrophicum S58]|uniref:Uncharacterized protein n=1 Tax=Bradyrhizobium oligotrophicum S58 TaxID=1245469 RepID=M4Z7Y1_9BRAD|nr:hypothetical protein S58_34840 [Bradyrhizobium oligotrophicum S58]